MVVRRYRVSFKGNANVLNTVVEDIVLFRDFTKCYYIPKMRSMWNLTCISIKPLSK